MTTRAVIKSYKACSSLIFKNINKNVLYIPSKTNLNQKSTLYNSYSSNNNNNRFYTTNNNNNKKNENVAFYQPPPKPGPQIDQLTKEQFSKSLLLMRRSGTLSSVDLLASTKDETGTPLFGSVSPYTLLEEDINIGDDSNSTTVKVYNPVFQLKKTSQHVKHFKHYNKVSLVVYPLTPVERPPAQYDLPRINFSGRMTRLVGDQVDRAKKSFLKRHPGAGRLLDDPESDFYEMKISDIYYYDRKVKLSFLTLDNYNKATPDPVTIESRDIIETVNDKYTPSLKIIAEQYGDVKIDEAFIYFIDRKGFNCIGKKKGIEEWLDIRVPFDAPFDSYKDCKDGFIQTIEDIMDKHSRL
eukprot:gene7679-9447_t